MSYRKHRLQCVLLAAALLASACTPDAANPVAGPLDPARSTTFGATLLECPVGVSSSTSSLIGPLGGILELNGHRVVVPPLAVAVPTTLTLTEPASNYVEVEVGAAGTEHYEFLRPIALTLSYARCTRNNTEDENLRIFYIDPATKAILEDLGGTDDKTVRTVSTSTDHLSGYAVGGN